MEGLPSDRGSHRERRPLVPEGHVEFEMSEETKRTLDEMYKDFRIALRCIELEWQAAKEAAHHS